MIRSRGDAGKDCPVCGTSFAAYFSDRGADWGRCPTCGLVALLRRDRTGPESRYSSRYFHSPRPEEYGYADYPGEEHRLIRSFRMKARLISPRLVRNTGRVLDVGCAAGFFLKVMKERGWWVNGIDICPEMARYAGKIAGRRGIHLGPADQSVWPADMFDLVTLWDTIEHVGDPVGLIRKCSIWLHQGGAICLETQDPESWLARLAGPRWHHYKPAEHLWHFPVRSLGRLLADQGFDDIRVTRRGAGRWVSWDYILTKAGRYLPVLRREKPAGIPGRFEWYVNPGDEYIMTAVKSGSVKKESGREKRIRL